MSGEKPKVVLAYSGGLDTSVILAWLVDKGYDVICYCANVGQQGEDYEKVRAKALSCGAIKVYIEDLSEDFVKNYVFTAVKANAIYESRYLLGTSIARPCIAKRQIEIAQKEGAKFVSHGATGKGNDQVRFEMCAQALDATITTIAPWRDPEFLEKFKGRKDLLAYAAEKSIPVDATPKAPYSVDENLFHTSYESGMLEDPMIAPMPEMFKMTVDPKVAPESGVKIRIDFEKGVPTKLTNHSDGTVKTKPLELFTYLNEVAGAHGVGRIDIVENRFVGIKSRGVYETPAGSVLREAHLDLEGMTLDREVVRIRDMMSSEFSRLCYNGFWFAPEMELVMNSLEFAQRSVTGGVELELYKGNIIILGRESPNALYSADLASMDIDDGGAAFDYNPMDSQGFIRINSVRLKAYYHLQRKAGEGKGGKKKDKEKKDPALKKGLPPKDAAPASPDEEMQKKRKKVIKEGGKRGVEIEGAADMGGLQFFSTSVDEPQGDLEMLVESMSAMNNQPIPGDEERKGCSGHIGKMIFSAGVDQLALVAYVPAEMGKDAGFCEEWLKAVLASFGGEVTSASAGMCQGRVKADGNKNIFPLKIREPMILESNNFLRKKGLFPEDHSDDDEMVFGDDDFPS